MKIAENILAILDNCRIEGNTVFLPPEQLDRKVYTAVNKCLENIGGKWNRKAKGHIFEDEPKEALENLILTGETEDIKKTFQFFPTPKEVAEKLCELAELTADSCVLEPSVGKGDLADVIWSHGVKDIMGVELNMDMEKHLTDKPYTTMTGLDFIEFANDRGVVRDYFSHVDYESTVYTAARYRPHTHSF